MQEKLIGYLLKALEPDELAAVEEMIRSKLEVRRLIELLQRALEPLQYDDLQDLEMPLELAARTCRLVRETRQA